MRRECAIYFPFISSFTWLSRFIASRGVRLFTSVEESLSNTDLCFSTNSMSWGGFFVLCFARCWPEASLAKVDSNSSRISFERSTMDFGMPANLATWIP